MHTVVEPEIGQRQHARRDREKDHHIDDGPPRDDGAQNQHGRQRDHGRDQGQDGQELLIKAKHVNVEPREPFPRQWRRPKRKDDRRCAHQHPRLRGRQGLHQLTHKQEHNGHGADKDDLLSKGHLAQPNDQGEDHERPAANEIPGVDLRALIAAFRGLARVVEAHP